MPRLVVQCKRSQEESKRHQKEFQRNSKKPLDKPLKMCYNKGTKGEGKATREQGVPTRASKTFAPWPDRKVCRFAEYKCEPEPVCWRNAGLCLLQSNALLGVSKNGLVPISQMRYKRVAPLGNVLWWEMWVRFPPPPKKFKIPLDKSLKMWYNELTR